MSHLPSLVKRLSLAVLGACLLLLGTPLLTAAPAQAGTPSGPATIRSFGSTTMDPQFNPAAGSYGVTSVKNDQYDNRVKLSADTTVPGPGQDLVASVTFTSTQTSAGYSGVATIATVYSAPWETYWNPVAYNVAEPNDSNYRMTVTAKNAAGGVIATAAQAMVIALDDWTTVHITTAGSAITTAANGTLTVSGTRSYQNASTIKWGNVQPYIALRDNSVGTTGAYTALPLIAGTSGNTWSTTFTPPTCPNTDPSGCDLMVQAAVLDDGPQLQPRTQEGAQFRIRSYVQTRGSMSVTPTTTTTGLGTTQNYVVKALDQNGNPMSGVGVVLSTTASGTNAAVISGLPGSNLTNYDGLYYFSLTDATAETTTVTVAGSGATSATATLTTAGPSGGTITGAPVKALYAVPFTGVQAGSGSSAPIGTEVTAATPAVKMCFTYPNGAAIDSSLAVNTSKVSASVVRTVKNGTVSTPGASTAVVLTQDQTANPGCYLATRSAAGSEEQGSDAYTGLYDADGTAGYQPGSDVQVLGSITWGQLKVTGSTTTAVKGANATIIVTAKTPDGRVFAGRKLNLAISSPASSTLAPTQPVGTTPISTTTATCLTDSNGACQLSVTDSNSITTVITARDNVTDPTLGQVATGSFGTAQVAFNATPGGLDGFGSPSFTLLQPAVNPAGSRLRPGDVAAYAYTLLDTNPAPLVNKTVTLTLTNGYFTPDCATYAACTFSPAAGDGNTISAPASTGKTKTVTSDSAGVIRFNTAIGRDAQLDATGTLRSAVTAVMTGGAANAELTTFSTLGTALANTTNLILVPMTSADALTGNVAANGSNKIPGQTGLLTTPGTDFQIRVTDGFGNRATLSSCTINLTVAPVGAQSAGPSAYLGSPGNTTASGCGSFSNATVNGVAPESFRLDSDNVSTTGNAVTLTSSWAVPSTIFRAVAGSTPTTYTTVNGTAPALTTTNTLTLYAIDQRTLTTTLSNTVGTSSAPITTAQINTIVTTTARIADTNGNPLQGATVTFSRSGPNNAAGTAQTASSTAVTDSNGIASATLTSPTTGTASILAIATNSAGTELTRGTTTLSFTTGPAPTPTPTPTATGSPTASPTPTGTAGPTPTPTGTPTPRPTGTPTGSPTATPTPTTTATPSPTATPVPTSPAGSTVTINGGDWQAPRFNTIFTITGTAPAGAVVTLRFHKSGTPVGSYGLTRTLTTPANGIWARQIAASFDYRYYATIDTSNGTTTAVRVSSANVLFQPTPLIDGPLNIATAKNLPFTITGQAAPYSLLFVHFHKNGTPAADYSIIRAVRTDAAGTWARTILASSDYRYYASRNPAATPTGKASYHLITR